MSESAEHRFISETFLSALETFSASRLYTYSEADRKALDFACSLERDWQRVLAGQTLWKHSAGIAKDLLYLLSEDQAAIVAYVARHNSANEHALFDLVEHVRRSRFATELRRLRIFWIADDFDADDELKRTTLRQHIEKSIANDILLNIVFGRLSAVDVRFFLANASMPGLLLATLHTIAKQGFFNYTTLSKAVGVSASTLRPRISALVTSGMLGTYPAEAMYFVSSRGRVLLDICYQISKSGSDITPELSYILDLLQINLNQAQVDDYYSLEAWQLRSPADGGSMLLGELHAAATRFGVDMEGPPYQIDSAELSNDRILLR
jgi:hypothetical protein